MLPENVLVHKGLNIFVATSANALHQSDIDRNQCFEKQLK